MLKRRPETESGTPMDMPGVEGVTMRLMVGREDGAPNFSMRHFTVEPGGHTPRHEHNYEHEVFIVEGRGRFEHEGELHSIEAGDVLYVEPNCIHQFVNDTDEPLKFLCLVPGRFDCGAGEMASTPGS